MPSAAADAGRLRAPPVDERLAVGEVVGRLAVVAVGAHDEHDPVALGRGPGHRAARQPGLVVGVGVDEHDRGHAAPRVSAPISCRPVDLVGSEEVAADGLSRCTSRHAWSGRPPGSLRTASAGRSRVRWPRRLHRWRQRRRRMGRLVGAAGDASSAAARTSAACSWPSTRPSATPASPTSSCGGPMIASAARLSTAAGDLRPSAAGRRPAGAAPRAGHRRASRASTPSVRPGAGLDPAVLPRRGGVRPGRRLAAVVGGRTG